MASTPLESRPEYLVLGHVTKDLLGSPPEPAPGGTATYAALLAARLGLQAAVVTACAPEDHFLLDGLEDEGVWVHCLPSAETTTFRNVYDAGGRRTQTLKARAQTLAPEDVPPAWREAPVVHLGPVAQELASGFVDSFPGRLLGVTPQGWMRTWGSGGQVRHSATPVPHPLLRLGSNAFLVLSVEDLGYDPDLISSYSGLAPRVAITDGEEDARLYIGGECIMVPSFRTTPVDPTGAGDVFAAALFIRFEETGDPVDAARFAHAAAACNIEGPGVSAIPDRKMVLKRMGAAK